MLRRVEPKTLNPKYENNLREDHLFYCLLAAIRIINQPLIPRYLEIQETHVAILTMVLTQMWGTQ